MSTAKKTALRETLGRRFRGYTFSRMAEASEAIASMS